MVEVTLVLWYTYNYWIIFEFQSLQFKFVETNKVNIGTVLRYYRCVCLSSQLSLIILLRYYRRQFASLVENRLLRYYAITVLCLSL